MDGPHGGGDAAGGPRTCCPGGAAVQHDGRYVARWMGSGQTMGVYCASTWCVTYHARRCVRPPFAAGGKMDPCAAAVLCHVRRDALRAGGCNGAAGGLRADAQDRHHDSEGGTSPSRRPPRLVLLASTACSTTRSGTCPSRSTTRVHAQPRLTCGLLPGSAHYGFLAATPPVSRPACSH